MTKARITDIEVLRAVAVLFVLFQHVGNLFPWAVPALEWLYGYLGGMFGVDLFFAVSGFVIARDLVPRLLAAPDHRTAWKTMLAFWLRRIWRLWPSAWLWLGVILLAVLAFNSSGAFGSWAANVQATYAGVFQYANVRFAQTFMVREFGASFVYWSLSLEEQFYLLFPFLIILFRRHLVWLLLVIALLQMATPRQHAYLMMFRTDALALGILLALWSQKASWQVLLPVFSGMGKWVRLLLVLACVAAMAALSSRLDLSRYNVGIIAALSALLVLMASYDRDLLLPAGRFKTGLLWIGERSYALYLIHVPVYFATREFFYRAWPDQIASAPLTLAYLACALILLVVLAELNFRLLETPLRRHGAVLSAGLLRRATDQQGDDVAAAVVMPKEPVAMTRKPEYVFKRILHMLSASQRRSAAVFVRLLGPAHAPMLVSAVLVVAVVLFIRLFLGFEFPIPWNDETAFTAQAFEFSRSGSFFVWGLNSERVVMWMPPGYMLLLAGVYKVFGYSFEISRWVSCLLYLGSFAVALAIVRSTFTAWRRNIALLLLLVTFLSPYSLAISNIARMEALYTLLFLLSLLAALREKYALGLALVLLAATVHFNAVYFLLPYAVLVLWKILRRETLSIGPGELLALVIAALALAGYGLFVIKHIDGFWRDMQFQFAYKLGSPVMSGRAGWTLLGLLALIPVLQLLVHRRLGREVWLSLYGVAFIAMTLNGHNMWYYFAYNFGFCLLLLGVLVSTTSLSNVWWHVGGVFIAGCLLYQLGHYANRNTLEFDSLKPRLSMLSRDFLPPQEIQHVRTFIAGLPAGATVSFGYSGVEPFFFEDFARAGARWSISGTSVTQVLPVRALDYRVFCDSAMFPTYLSLFDWDGYPRKSQDSGCKIVRLSPPAR